MCLYMCGDVRGWMSMCLSLGVSCGCAYVSECVCVCWCLFVCVSVVELLCVFVWRHYGVCVRSGCGCLM